MATVKAPLLSSEARGAVGGIEFRLIHGRNIVGRRSVATRTLSPALSRHQAYLSQGIKSWYLQTAATRALWQKYHWGSIPAQTAYQMGYARLRLRSVPDPMTPPMEVRTGRISAPSLQYGPLGLTTIKLRWTRVGTLYNYLYVYSYGSYRRYANPPRHQARYLISYQSNDTPEKNITIAAMPHMWFRICVVAVRNGRTLQEYWIRVDGPGTYIPAAPLTLAEADLLDLQYEIDPDLEL